jgi:teichuronic acid biosynthesis glycosyltransferase TuaG
MINLSVIIPVFNRDLFIEQCVNSVLNQNIQGCSYEVIVVDDGSTDDTAKVLSKFKDKIKYIRIVNSGRPAVPRNAGLKIAKGELVAFQDSDDIWLENKLRDQLKDFRKSNVLAYANASIVDENNQKIGRNLIKNSQAHSGMVFKYLLKENFVSTLTVIANKKILLNLGGFNESKDYLEDYDMWLRMSLKGKFIYTPKTLARYRIHKSNISSGSEIKDLKNIYKIMNNLNSQVGSSDRQLILERKKEIVSRLAQISSGADRFKWKIKGKVL